MKRKLFRQALAMLAMAALGPAALANAYPERTVRIVVPFPAGAATDNMARLLAQRLQTSLGQSFIVDNRAGASGMIGAQSVATSPADGYTLLYTASGPISTALKLYDKVPYDAARDFAPISLVIANTVVITGSTKAPERSFNQYMQRIKANPGKVSFGFGPAGGLPHLMMAMFTQQTGTSLNFVPYKGGAPVLVDMIGGTLDMAAGNLSETMEHLRSGKIVPLAMASTARSPLFPDVPTLTELGYPNMVTETWSALLAPAGTPEPIVRRLNEEVRKIQTDPSFMAEVARQAAVIKMSTPEEAKKFIAAETERWGKVATDAGIKAN